jgi:polar amino acid transport system substrate-binding protein
MSKGKLFVVLVFINNLLFSNAVFADKTLVFPTDPWPPFMLGKEGDKSTEGVGTELMQAIFERIDGMDITNPLVPWKRALHSVEQGKADAIPLLYKTEEREKIMDFSDPLFPSQDLAWYSKSHFPNGLEWQVADDFIPYRIGVVSDYSYSEEIDQAMIDKKFVVTKVKNAKQLFTMLAGGRVDVILANRVVGIALIKSDFENRNITSMSKPIAEENYHTAFSKKKPLKEFIVKFNRAIAELKSEGRIEKIIYGE